MVGKDGSRVHSYCKVLDLLTDSDLGYSDTESDESEEDVYSYHGNPDTDFTELTSLKASVEGSSSVRADLAEWIWK